MAIHPQCWDISVFLLYQKLAEPLIVGEAPPHAKSCRSYCLLDGMALQFGNNQCTGYITVEITKLLVYNHYNTTYGYFTFTHI